MDGEARALEFEGPGSFGGYQGEYEDEFEAEDFLSSEFESTAESAGLGSGEYEDEFEGVGLGEFEGGLSERI